MDMITLERYLSDPCGSLSIPYWKWKTIVLPEDMKILHHRDYTPIEGYRDDVYFRLKHDLKQIESSSADVKLRRIEEKDWDTVVGIIHRCYPRICFHAESLGAMMKTKVYSPELWLMAELQGQPVGCILADLDREAGEGILEWVQVLPEYRGRGVGKTMVLEVLRRMDADFATVSGQVANVTAPEKLYRACGFYGNDLWHILKRI